MTNWEQYFAANPDVAAAYQQNNYGLSPEQFATTHFQKYGQGEGRSGLGLASLSPHGEVSIGRNAAGYADAGAQDQYQGALGANTGHRQLADGSWETIGPGSAGRRPQAFSGGTYSGWQNTVARQRGQLPPVGGPQVMPGIGGQRPPHQSYSADPNDPFSGLRVDPIDPNYGQISALGIGSMMNPYLSSVRDQTLSDLERQRVLAQTQTDDAALGAKAFGGNRHGIANALTNDAFAREAGRQFSGLNAQGFNTAAGLAGQNVNSYLSGRAQDIGQNQGFMGGALAQRAQDIGQTQFNANLGLQQRGQDLNYNLGEMGQRLNAYNIAGNLYNQAGNMDWNSTNQASNAVGGANSGQATQTTPGADPWNSIIGGLLTGLGLTRG